MTSTAQSQLIELQKETYDESNTRKEGGNNNIFKLSFQSTKSCKKKLLWFLPPDESVCKIWNNNLKNTHFSIT